MITAAHAERLRKIASVFLWIEFENKSIEYIVYFQFQIKVFEEWEDLFDCQSILNIRFAPSNDLQNRVAFYNVLCLPWSHQALSLYSVLLSR